MRILLSIVLLAASLNASDFKAGVARLKITPEFPVWMAGYASRTHPSEGVVMDLWARALALEDRKGHRVVIVTTDIIGLPRSIAELVAARVQKQWGLDRSQLVLNSAHTHTGPQIRSNLDIMFDLKGDDAERLKEYASKLTDDLVNVVGAAIGDLAPAEVSYGTGEAGFAMNRRERTPAGTIKLGVNPKGPTDHEVPVMKVVGSDGKLRAVLFAYACHNTTLGGDFYKITGDYAGFAEAELEKQHPGAAAMFMLLCGADQNPYPRGTLENAQVHGKTLAGAVDRAMSGKMQRVRGPIRSAFQVVELGFTPRDRADFERMLTDKNPIRVRYAKEMLKGYDERRPNTRIRYPIQAVNFKDVALVALGGEVVVDYQLRIKREFKGAPIVVAGYSNDVMCYIPSARMLKEGGYEVVDSMTYYGMPGPFNGDVEDTIITGVKSVLKRVGR